MRVGDKVFSNRFTSGEEENRLKTRANRGETAMYFSYVEDIQDNR
jgi:hypothetical protein